MQDCEREIVRRGLTAALTQAARLRPLGGQPEVCLYSCAESAVDVGACCEVCTAALRQPPQS